MFVLQEDGVCSQVHVHQGPGQVFLLWLPPHDPGLLRLSLLPQVPQQVSHGGGRHWEDLSAHCPCLCHPSSCHYNDLAVVFTVNVGWCFHCLVWPAGVYTVTSLLSSLHAVSDHICIS